MVDCPVRIGLSCQPSKDCARVSFEGRSHSVKSDYMHQYLLILSDQDARVTSIRQLLPNSVS